MSTENRLGPEEAVNIVIHLYDNNGGGVAGKVISGNGLPDPYFTNNQTANK